jgi:hypothetical protein
MHRWRSTFRTAALLEFLAAAAGAWVIATYLRATANDLCGFFRHTKVIVVADQSRRLAATLFAPIGVDSHQQRFEFLYPFLGGSILADALDTIFGSEVQERREPCGLSDG